VAGYRPLPPLPPGGEDQERAAGWLNGKGPPPVKLPDVTDPDIAKVLEAIRNRAEEREVLVHARKVNRAKLDDAIAAAEEESARIDRAWEPVLKHLDDLVHQSLGKVATTRDDARATAAAEASVVQAARFDVDYRRYRAEATLNQGIGFLYEVRVKTSTVASDRHRTRSQNFFYAMLAAQVGATVAALGLARRRRSAVWLIAGLAGVVAVSFGVYVYLEM
jgi:hypothetical protein